MHPALAAIAQATTGTPYENKLWLVGGAVRDDLLGKKADNDFDIVLESDASALTRLLEERGISTSRPVEYPRFGTAMIQVEGATIEFVTARKESYDENSRKPDVAPGTLEEDAQRRDFTINTLMRNLHTGELKDPLGTGLEDLKSKLLRTPLDPAATFFDDPLRMLRAVRFRWQLGFHPAEGLYKAIEQEHGRLRIISAERIRDEWTKMLMLHDAPQAMSDLLGLNLLSVFAPEFEAAVGVEQGRFHHLDVWEHTLLVLANLIKASDNKASLELRLGALFHDIAKPATRMIDEDGNTRFFGHEALGAELTRTMLRRLKFSGEEVETVALLVRNHMRLGTFDEFSAAAARRLIRDVGPHLYDLITLVEADANSLRPGVKALNLDPVRERVAEVLTATPRDTLESPLDGAEIMSLLGLEPGPEVGKVKEFLLEKVLEGELAPDDKDGAKAALRTFRT